MDRHTCKLCFRRFPNGRALGGHMRSHVTSAAGKPRHTHPAAAALRTHRAPAAHMLHHHSSTSSPSHSTSQGRQDHVTPIRAACGVAGKAFVAAAYVLRENPRKSYRMVDPEFSSTFEAPPTGPAVAGFESCYYSTTTSSSPFFGSNADGTAGIGNPNNNSSSAVVQDGESETESSRAPAASSSRFRRSKRRRRYEVRSEADEEEREDDAGQLPQRRGSSGGKKLHLKTMRVSEPDQQPVSSVSDTTPEEDVARCLMMLSRDVWTREEGEEGVGDGRPRGDDEECEDGDEPPTDGFDGEYYLDAGFHSDPAEGEDELMGSGRGRRLRMLPRRRKGGVRARFRCGTCNKLFRSYQALGGHRASHKKAGTCYAAADAASTPLINPYKARPAAADTPPVRRSTPRILVDDYNERNVNTERIHDNHYDHHQRHRISSTNRIRQKQQTQHDEDEDEDPDWGEAEAADDTPTPPDPRIHECPFCFRVFSSGQALGGHKRSHLIAGAAYRIPYTTIRPNAVAATNTKLAPVNNRPSPASASAAASATSRYKLTIRGTPRLLDSFIDLNLPAPIDEGEEEEEDGSYVELSALSDAE